MVFPSTACLIQKKLGIHGCPAFDVQAVCSGFVYALTVADALIRAGRRAGRWSLARRCFRILDFRTAPPACSSAMALVPWCWRRLIGLASWRLGSMPMGSIRIFSAPGQRFAVGKFWEIPP